MGDVERPTRLQPHDEGLRRLEHPAAVEQVAQAAPGEVLGDPEPRRPPWLADREVDLAEVGDAGDVRVGERGRQLAAASEPGVEPLAIDHLGPDDLHGDRLFGGLVERDRDDRVGASRHHRLDDIASREGLSDETVDRIIVLGCAVYHDRETLSGG